MTAVDGTGWHERARRVESPNCDDRPEGAEAELVVLHCISLPRGRFGGGAIEDLFMNRTTVGELAGLRVSAHFLVRRDGGLVQFVPCTRRAWHAGDSSWRGRTSCNDYSIGIELEGTDDTPFEEAQYRSLASLLGDLRAACPSLRKITGHSHVAPGRKTDPGTEFDWGRLFKMVGEDMDGRNGEGEA